MKSISYSIVCETPVKEVVTASVSTLFVKCVRLNLNFLLITSIFVKNHGFYFSFSISTPDTTPGLEHGLIMIFILLMFSHDDTIDKR